MHASGHPQQAEQDGTPSLHGAFGVPCRRDPDVGNLVEQLGGAIEGLHALCADHVRVWAYSASAPIIVNYPWRMEIFTNPIGGEPGVFSSEMVLGFRTRESAPAYYALRSIREGRSPDIKEILASESQSIAIGSNTLRVKIYQSS